MFTLKFKTVNAAFGNDDPTEDEESEAEAMRLECARILRHVAKQLENGAVGGACMDVNGNRVGDWSL